MLICKTGSSIWTKCMCYASITLWTRFVIICDSVCCKWTSELLVNVTCDVYVEWCHLGCKRVDLKSLVVSIDYRDYMGSSSKIWAFRRLFLYLCSYNLVGSVIAGTGAEFNIKHIVRVFENKSVLFAKSVKNLKFIFISMPVVTSLSPNKDS
jgi:hypothetical protein